MISATHVSRGKQFLLREVFTDQGLRHFWDERFLPRWLPLLLGLFMGGAAAAVVASEQWFLLVPLALVVPAGILFLRYPFAAVLLWLLARPLLPHAETGSAVLAFWGLHRLMIPGALGVAILSDWLGLRKRRSVRFGAPELFMVFFLLYGLLNMLVLFEPGPRASMLFYDYVVVPFCLYWLVRLLAPGDRDLRRLVWVAVFLVVTQVAVSVVHWFAPALTAALWDSVPGRNSGTLGSPYPLAVALIFSSLLILQQVVGSERSTARHFLLLVVLVGFFGVFFSFQRTAWLGGILVAVGLATRYPKTTLKLAAVAVVASVILGATVLSSEVQYAAERLNSDRSAISRLVIYDAAVKMIVEQPLLGRGYRNYDLYDEQYKTRVFGVPADWGDLTSSHNAYLTIMVEFGLVGFALYMFPVAWWLRHGLRQLKRLPERRFEGASWLLMLCLALIQQLSVGVFSDVFSYQSSIQMTTWLTLALLATVLWRNELPASHEQQLASVVPRSPGERSRR